MEKFLAINPSVLAKQVSIGALLCACACPASGQVSMDLPDLQLTANTANQSFVLRLDNVSPQQVTGLNLVMEVTGTGQLPTISSIDLVDGTIFTGLQGNQSGTSLNSGTAYEVEVITSSGTVTLSSGNNIPYATVVFSTAGLLTGQYGFTLTPPSFPGAQPTYTTTGSEIFPTTFTGTLTIVPEPATYALLTGVGCLAFGVWRRRK